MATTFPHLVDRYAGDLTAIPVEQRWFARHQILRLDCLMATGLRVFAARGSGRLVLLSGRLDRLEELVERERPRGLDVGTVAVYAAACDEWTSPYDMRPTTISALEDLMWSGTRPGDAERMTRLAEELAGKLHPPRVTRSAGNTYVVRCVLTGVHLVRRKLTVDANGAMRREDQVLAERMPSVLLRG